MRTSELGIVIVVMIVRTLPDAAGAQSKNAENPHVDAGQTRIRQDGMVLLVVVDHEQS
jgi:hypothetical protein